jgi:hypothetical protein
MRALAVGALALCGGLFAAAPAHAQITRIPQPRTARAARAPSLFVHAEGGLGLPGAALEYDTTVPDNAEDAPYTVELDRPASPALDVGAWYRISPRFGVGFSVSAGRRTSSGTVSGESPHPFFFNQPRAIIGDIDNVNSRETALHFELVVPLSVTGFSVSVFGGPSVLVVRHDVLNSVEYADEYPYDTATFTSATTRVVQERGFGYNVGAEGGAMLTPRVGIGARVRYIGGSVDLPATTGPISFTISTLQITAGVRLAF